MPSQTRKKSKNRSPKQLKTFEWLGDPMEQLRRSVSFEGREVSDEEFYRFFNSIGEGSSKSRSRNRSRSASKSRKSPKSPKSPGKSPKAAKSPKSTKSGK